MTTPQYVQIIADALDDLRAAATSLADPTTPPAPPPRPRVFTIAPGVTWPFVGATPDKLSPFLTVLISNVGGPDLAKFNCYTLGIAAHTTIATIILERCKYQPRLVLRALRRIQAATAWCRARAEGRRRAAQEILRRQSGRRQK